MPTVRTYSLLQKAMNTNIADSFFNEILTGRGRYYYFIGKTLPYENASDREFPVDSHNYEIETRNNIIALKEIRPSDISYVVNRIDWTSGEVYDMYDDTYNDQLQGINLISGGAGYTNPQITIESDTGDLATAVARTNNGKIVGIDITNRGYGYKNADDITITIVDNDATEQAVAEAVITTSVNGNVVLEDTKFYVYTDDFNIYKCLNNNGGQPSSVKPTGTSIEPFGNSDGYVWKYISTIPVSARNKFQTNMFLPVSNALTRQYYSRGSIFNIFLDAQGDNYTTASVAVSGDGYIESDPVYLNPITLVSGGDSYTAIPDITIDAPRGLEPTAWGEGIPVATGYVVEYNNNLYEALQSGTLAIAGPIHLKDTFEVGGIPFRYVGTRATARAVLDDDSVGSVEMNGSIRQINITDGGSGYTTSPEIFVENDEGRAPLTETFLNNDSVLYVSVIDGGDGFYSNPDVVVGKSWVASAIAQNGEQIAHQDSLYTVITNSLTATLGTTAPTHTTGTETNGEVSLEYAGKRATARAVRKYGSGYDTPPTVSIEGIADISISVNKSEALVIPVIEGGHITNLIIQDGGIGYTFANLQISGDGSGVSARANLDIGDFDTIQANSELLVTHGALSTIVILSNGYSYPPDTAIPLTIEGDGSGAIAFAETDGEGRVRAVRITDYGQDYTYADISIPDTAEGRGATARAVISPYGGHGRNPIDDLFASNLMLSVSFSNNNNHGFSNITNDYRQIGVVANPKVYSETYNPSSALFRNAEGSACWVIPGSYDVSHIENDKEITVGDNKYVVVAYNASSLLVQSLENAMPQASESIIIEGDNTTRVVADVLTPHIDKFSGDMVFIDNRQSFIFGENRNIFTFQTILKF